MSRGTHEYFLLVSMLIVHFVHFSDSFSQVWGGHY